MHFRVLVKTRNAVQVNMRKNLVIRLIGQTM